MRATLSRLLRFLRWIVSSDELETSAGGGHDSNAPGPRNGRTFWRRILSREALEDATVDRREPRSGFLPFLLGREELPEEAAEEPDSAARRGLMGLLFARERLPEDPPPDKPPVRRPERIMSLRLLFSGEHLEELQDDEVPGRRRRGIGLGWLFAREQLDRDGAQSERERTVR